MIDVESLDGVPSLAEVSGEARIALAERMREVEFAEGERLVPLLDPPERLLFLVEGLAKMAGVSANGIERIVYVFRPGEVTGSRILLDESEEAAFAIVAMEPVRAMSISKRDFLAVSEIHSDVLVAITREFTRRLDEMTNRILAAMSTEVPVRLSQLLLDFTDGEARPDDELIPLSSPLTHESMAQIIGASRPHTSTVLRDLEREDAVRRKSDRGLLVRRSKLREIVSREGLDTAI